MNPRDQRRVTAEAGHLAMQQDEHRLGDILGQRRIAHAAAGDAVHPADVAGDDLAKRFVVAAAMLFQQIDVAHLRYVLRA